MFKRETRGFVGIVTTNELESNIKTLKQRDFSIEMAEELKKHGLFVDESFVLRVLEPNVAKDTQDLKEENEIFLESKLHFTSQFINLQ